MKEWGSKLGELFSKADWAVSALEVRRDQGPGPEWVDEDVSQSSMSNLFRALKCQPQDLKE